MGQVEGSDAQGPEAAEHGEDAKAQVVPRGHHEEVVLALCVTGVVALPGEMGMESEVTRGLSIIPRSGAQAWQALLASVCPPQEEKNPKDGLWVAPREIKPHRPADLWDGVWTAG